MKPILRNLLGILIVFSVSFLGTLVFLHIFTRHGQDYILPDFSGMSIEEASDATRSLSLRLEVTDSLYMPNLPKGVIFKQTPPPGEHIKKNRRIELTVNSIIPRQVVMPSLVGFSLRQAKAEIAAHSLLLGRLIYKQDIATNNVLDQMFQGRPIAPGTLLDITSPIDLVLGMSSDNSLAYIPVLKGMGLESAKDVITDHSLNVGRIKYDASVQTAADTLAARVYHQVPAYTPLPEWPLGTQVHLTLTINADLLVPQEQEEDAQTAVPE